MQITCPNCDHQWDTKLPRPGPLTCPQCQYRRQGATLSASGSTPRKRRSKPMMDAMEAGQVVSQVTQTLERFFKAIQRK